MTRALVCLATAIATFALLAGTGFGATSSTRSPTATVASTIQLVDPTALGTAPPVCTAALAPLDTDDCGDAAFSAGPPRVLSLGELTGDDVQAASLTWKVTTTSPTGYTVTLSNTGSSPMMKSSAGSIDDMPTSPIAASAVDDATHFGVAAGNPATDGEGAVAFGGTPWVSGGQHGERFRGVPTGGVIVASRADARTNDPFTLTFAAASVADDAPPAGSYTGTARLVASTI